MSSPRLRRLRLDHERLHTRLSDWPVICIQAVDGTPPEKYQVSYNIRGIYSTPTGQILERNHHVAEIQLSLAYPRRAPQCKMLTPVFHPNFDEVSICIGDFWAASEGLDDLIVRIGRMIAYQEYNVKSPLNGLAAKWAAQNAHMLPVDITELSPPAEYSRMVEDEKIVVKIDGEVESEGVLSEVPDSPEASAHAASAVEPRGYRLNFGLMTVTLRSERTLVGRALGNDIQLQHDSVAGIHAEMIETDSGVYLRGGNSSNVCIINGAPIPGAWLNAGDKLSFGQIEAVFLDPAV